MTACDVFFNVFPRGNASLTLLSGLENFLSGIATISVTFMTALKIILVTRRSHAQSSYSKIIDIVVQSAALQSFFHIISSISQLLSYALIISNSDNVSLGSLFLKLNAYATTCELVFVVSVYLKLHQLKNFADVDFAGNSSHPYSISSCRRGTSHRGERYKYVWTSFPAHLQTYGWSKQCGEYIPGHLYLWHALGDGSTGRFRSWSS